MRASPKALLRAVVGVKKGAGVRRAQTCQNSEINSPGGRRKWRTLGQRAGGE